MAAQGYKSNSLAPSPNGTGRGTPALQSPPGISCSTAFRTACCQRSGSRNRANRTELAQRSDNASAEPGADEASGGGSTRGVESTMPAGGRRLRERIGERENASCAATLPVGGPALEDVAMRLEVPGGKPVGKDAPQSAGLDCGRWMWAHRGRITRSATAWLGNQTGWGHMKTWTEGNALVRLATFRSPAAVGVTR